MVNVGNLRGRNSNVDAGGSSSSSSAFVGSNLMQIVEEIANKGSLTIPAETVRREIRQFFAKEKANGVDSSPFRLSLIDPISKLRIRIPVQSTKCDHFQCFDLYHFLEFSFKNNGEENKNAWRCPHCQSEAKQGLLRVDGYFQEILLNVGPEPLEVELFPDGNWREVEQLDFKELLAENDDIVEIIPKKRAKISDVPNSVENPQASNANPSTVSTSNNIFVHDEDNSQVFQELKRKLKASEAFNYQLGQILDLKADMKEVNEANIIDAVLKLKQKAEAFDKANLVFKSFASNENISKIVQREMLENHSENQLEERSNSSPIVLLSSSDEEEQEKNDEEEDEISEVLPKNKTKKTFSSKATAATDLLEHNKKTASKKIEARDLQFSPQSEFNSPGGKEAEAELEPGNMQTCRICNQGDFLLMCTHCPSSYHAFCLSPPLKKLIEEEHLQNWVCPRCSIPDPGQQKQVEEILSWRWIEIRYPDPLEHSDVLKEDETLATLEDTERKNRLYLHPPTQMKPRREREFFIKWKYMSYWHCNWVNELLLKLYFAQTLRMYWREMDPETPPEIDDDSFENMKTGIIENKGKEADPHNMEQKFYRYGIKPEWMQVQRIINHASYKKNEFDYLVKWRELAYEQATWEPDEALYIPGFEEAVHKYWMHRERMTGEAIPRCILEKINQKRAEKGHPSFEEEETKRKKREGKPSTDIEKTWVAQPDYVSETGGTLHPYQLEGINWLRHCWAAETNALLATKGEGHTKGPFLIAAPLSTLTSWQREAEFWAPDLYVVLYNGNADSRTVIRDHEFSFAKNAVTGGSKASRLRTDHGLKFHVMLTSYELISIDRAILSSIEWAALIVDEAHRLKNNQSLYFRSLRDYSLQYRLLLTGKPLQNNLEELFHLLNFLSPDRFYDLESFTEEFAEISREAQIQKLNSLLGPQMLRRSRADIPTGIPSKRK